VPRRFPAAGLDRGCRDGHANVESRPNCADRVFKRRRPWIWLQCCILPTRAAGSIGRGESCTHLQCQVWINVSVGWRRPGLGASGQLRVNARRPAVSELIMRFGPAKASFSLGGDKMALQWDQSVLFPNC
jgi:hypothetical protein